MKIKKFNTLLTFPIISLIVMTFTNILIMAIYFTLKEGAEDLRGLIPKILLRNSQAIFFMFLLVLIEVVFSIVGYLRGLKYKSEKPSYIISYFIMFVSTVYAMTSILAITIIASIAPEFLDIIYNQVLFNNVILVILIVELLINLIKLIIRGKDEKN